MHSVGYLVVSMDAAKAEQWVAETAVLMDARWVLASVGVKGASSVGVKGTCWVVHWVEQLAGEKDVKKAETTEVSLAVGMVIELVVLMAVH